jgi:hypothetical protein
LDLVVVCGFESTQTALDGRDGVWWGDIVGVYAAEVEIVRVNGAPGWDDAVFDVDPVVHWDISLEISDVDR